MVKNNRLQTVSSQRVKGENCVLSWTEAVIKQALVRHGGQAAATVKRIASPQHGPS